MRKRYTPEICLLMKLDNGCSTSTFDTLQQTLGVSLLGTLATEVGQRCIGLAQTGPGR